MYYSHINKYGAAFPGLSDPVYGPDYSHERFDQTEIFTPHRPGPLTGKSRIHNHDPVFSTY